MNKEEISTELNGMFKVVEERGIQKILTPFSFRDGDCIYAVLKNNTLTDEGHVTMFDFSDSLENLKIAVGKVLKKFNGEYQNGAFVFPLRDKDTFSARLADYIQAILEIHNLGQDFDNNLQRQYRG